MSGRIRRACAGLLLIVSLCAAHGCGRKAKPEPLRTSGTVFFIHYS
jgi:hypothetical protein